MTKRSVNESVLMVFAPLLILVGVAGFLLPAEKSLTSGAPPYNIFHLFFGLLGLLVLATRSRRLAETFNVGFGLIDLYQAFASRAHIFPERLFRWTVVDDWLHVSIGLSLIAVGCYGAFSRRPSRNSQSTLRRN